MNAAALRRAARLGPEALLAVLVAAASVAVHVHSVMPLEESSRQLRLQMEDRTQRTVDPEVLKRVSLASAQGQLAAFYGFFERGEPTEWWLAKLYGIATAAGLEWRAADYRLSEPRYRLQRYQITLPVTGHYTEIRKFLEAALAEVPVASLDQVSFRRREANEPRVEAEIVLTLHLVPR